MHSEAGPSSTDRGGWLAVHDGWCYRPARPKRVAFNARYSMGREVSSTAASPRRVATDLLTVGLTVSGWVWGWQLGAGALGVVKKAIRRVSRGGGGGSDGGGD